MIKKIFVGVLLAAVFALLVLGAVNRTIAKSASREPIALSASLAERSGGSNGNQGQNQSLNKNSEDQISGNHAVEDETARCGDKRAETFDAPSGGQGYRNGDYDSPTGSNNGQGRQPRGSEGGTSAGIADVQEWLTSNGIVDSVSSDLWTVKLVDGSFVEIEGRLLSFLLENGFSASPGDEVVLTGFLEGEDFETGKIENLTTGSSIIVREESGRPFWAGGRGGGGSH